MSADNPVPRLDELFAQHKGIIEQLKKINARRAELRNEIGSLTDRLDVENEEHRQLRERLKALSESKQEVATRLHEGRMKFRSLSEKLKEIEPHLLRKGEGMEDELKKLEWRLQTQPLTREQEHEVLARVKELAKSVSVWKKAYNLREEAYKLEVQLNEDSARILEVKADHADVLRSLKEKRRKIRDLIEARKQVSEELRATDVDIAELERALHEVDSRIRAAKEQLAKEKETRLAAAERERLHLDRQALERVRSEALEKVRGGRSLTFDELRVLYGEDQSSTTE